MSATIHVLAIAGSLRGGSSNAAMLGAASRLAPTGMSSSSTNLGEASRPLPFVRSKLGGGQDLVDPDAVAVLRTSLDALAREVARTRGEWVGAT